jgi:hypothetical protein
MVEELTIKDFTIKYIAGSKIKYYETDAGRYTITLEPCLNGFNIAIYEKGNIQSIEKICTNLPTLDGEVTQQKLWEKALLLANKLDRKYVTKYKHYNKKGI